MLALLLVLGGLAWAQPSGRSDLRYPPDLASELVSEDDVRRVTACNASLSDDEVAEVLTSRPIPLQGLEFQPETKQHVVMPRTQWDVPPFPQVGPPPPSGLPPAAQALWLKTHKVVVEAPDVFSEVPTREDYVPSAMLRPRPGVSNPRPVLASDTEIPAPFSGTRYHAKPQGFFQLLVYGGSNSFGAEDAYRALRHAVEAPEALEGMGKEAFLARLPSPDFVEPPPPDDPKVMPFTGMDVVGRPRPDLLDPGLVKARQAPAFSDLPTAEPVKPAKPQPKQAEAAPAEPPHHPELMVLVAFFPDKALTVEMCLDERVGNVQHLIHLGMILQQKLIEPQ